MNGWVRPAAKRAESFKARHAVVVGPPEWHAFISADGTSIAGHMRPFVRAGVDTTRNTKSLRSIYQLTDKSARLGVGAGVAAVRDGGFNIEPQHRTGTGSDVCLVGVECFLHLCMGRFTVAGEVVDVVVGQAGGAGVIEVMDTIGVYRSSRAIAADNNERVSFVFEALVVGDTVEFGDIATVDGGDTVVADERKSEYAEGNSNESCEDRHCFCFSSSVLLLLLLFFVTLRVK